MNFPLLHLHGQIYLEELEAAEGADSWFVQGFEECLRRNPTEPDQSQAFEMSFEWGLAPDRLETAPFSENVRCCFRFDLFGTDEVNQVLDKRDRLSNSFKITRK